MTEKVDQVCNHRRVIKIPPCELPAPVEIVGFVCQEGQRPTCQCDYAPYRPKQIMGLPWRELKEGVSRNRR